MIGRLLLMVQKDLLRQWRSPLAMLCVLAFPLIFASLLMLAFGGGEPRIQVRLLVEDRDDSVLSQLLLGVLASDRVADHVAVRRVGEEGLRLIEQGEGSALLRVPPHFAADLLAGRPVTLELIRNPSEGILPEIAEQGLAVFADLLGAGSGVLREPLAELALLVESDGHETTPEEVARISVLFYEAIDRSSKLVLPPVITLERVQLTDVDGARKKTRGSIFLYVLPGISVWALFMVGDMAMRDILTEGVTGTLKRQLGGPVPPWEVVLGKVLYTAVLAAIGLVLLALIGSLVSGGGVSLPGFVLLSAAIVLAVTGFSAAVYGLAETERQGATVGSILLMVFAFLGGSFIQLDSLPASVRPFAPLSPFYWGTTGYHELLHRDGGPSSILPHAGVLLAIGVVGFLVGTALLGRRARRGVVA